MYAFILKSLFHKILDPGVLLYIMTFMRPSVAIKFEHKRN